MKNQEELIAKKVAEIAAIEDMIPAVIIIHNIQSGFTVEYMSERGRKILGVSGEELKAIGLEYYPRFFNIDDAQIYVPKMAEMIQRNNMDEVFTFFQQVRPGPEHPWQWYMSATKLLLRDKNGNPLLTITEATPINPEFSLTQKVERLLEENTFMRENYKKYTLLSKREKEVLRLMGQARSNKEIADEMFISVSTVETHRKNIRQKLKLGSNTELSLFLRAFDLV